MAGLYSLMYISYLGNFSKGPERHKSNKQPPLIRGKRKTQSNIMRRVKLKGKVLHL